MKEEIWKDVAGYEGMYMVSNKGRIKSFKRRVPIIMSNLKAKRGYACILITKNKKRKRYFIHRLVGIAFIPNPQNKPEINHKNRIKTDNSIENLEWVTGIENMEHYYGYRVVNRVKKWKKRTISVIQYDMHDNKICEFESVKSASLQTGINKKRIYNCISGEKKSACGYKWKKA